MKVSQRILCYVPNLGDQRHIKCLKRLKRSLFLRQESFFRFMKQTKSQRQIVSRLKASIYFILNSYFVSYQICTHFLTRCYQLLFAYVRLAISSLKLKSLVKTSETNGSNYSSQILIHSSSYLSDMLIFFLASYYFRRATLFSVLNASNFSLLIFSLAYSSICRDRASRSFFVQGQLASWGVVLRLIVYRLGQGLSVFEGTQVAVGHSTYLFFRFSLTLSLVNLFLKASISKTEDYA